MTECGHLMGHLAIPNKDGVLTYLPIRCNMSEGHLAPWSPHRFRDPMSGMQVNKTMFPARPSWTSAAAWWKRDA